MTSQVIPMALMSIPSSGAFPTPNRGHIHLSASLGSLLSPPGSPPMWPVAYLASTALWGHPCSCCWAVSEQNNLVFRDFLCEDSAEALLDSALATCSCPEAFSARAPLPASSHIPQGESWCSETVSSMPSSLLHRSLMRRALHCWPYLHWS